MRFQSPKNRVCISEARIDDDDARERISFNPLKIGSVFLSILQVGLMDEDFIVSIP